MCSAFTFTENRRIIKSRPPLSHTHTLSSMKGKPMDQGKRLNWGEKIGKFEFSHDQSNPTVVPS